MNLKIIVACHKEYEIPNAPCYVPVEVGAALRQKHISGFLRDDSGNNISQKNKHFCELTAIYWAWKNMDADAIGLVHYRRYFAKRKFSFRKKENIALLRDYECALDSHPVILPRQRNYYIESNYSQYIHAHHEKDLTITRAIIAEKCPEYLPAYDCWMAQTHGHHFNMFVMKKPLFDHYCEWLFDILFELERRLDISDYDEYNQRVFGFVSERLIDCWLETNNIRYTELPVVHLESQHWIKKGANFLMRKVTYRKSDW